MLARLTNRGWSERSGDDRPEVFVGHRFTGRTAESWRRPVINTTAIWYRVVASRKMVVSSLRHRPRVIGADSSPGAGLDVNCGFTDWPTSWLVAAHLEAEGEGGAQGMLTLVRRRPGAVAAGPSPNRRADHGGGQHRRTTLRYGKFCATRLLRRQ